MNEGDKQAVFHILSLAEQGRYEEIIAQMMGSYIICGDSDQGVTYRELWRQIDNRVIELLIDGSEIWEGLLPGHSVGVDDLDNFNLITTREWLRLKAFEEEVTKNETGLDLAAENKYELSLWKLQDIDGPATMLWHVESVEASSPLALADQVIEEMSKFSFDQGKDSMVMWITNLNQEVHLTMTWDQANVIKDLEGVIKSIEDITSEHPEFLIHIPDYSDEFQGIWRQMELAGEEFQRNRVAR